jgi:threonine dehydratase
MNLSLNTVHEVRKQLSRYLPQTRLAAAPSLSRAADQNVYLKLETELPTGSFKARGALYSLQVNLARREIREVVASSTGNHGAAVAYAAKLLKIPAVIFLPENPNPVKRKRIADLGAKIVEQGQDISDAFDGAVSYAQAEGVFLLNDATDPDLPAGPATIALEILEQLPETSQIYVPMGDTALIRGIGAAAKQISPGIRIVGVQAERAPSYFLSWKQDRVVTTESCNTIADGLATRTPVTENVKAIRELVDDVQLVSEEDMLDAVRHLLLEEHVVAEPSGAAAAAAFLNARSFEPGNIVLIVSGANIPSEVLRSALRIDANRTS